MFRIALFATSLSCCWLVDSVAAEPPMLTVVSADQAAASLLPPLPMGTSLTVLIEHDDDTYDVINARALAMRHATHYVYRHGQESPVSAMYR